jgi:hypothetical protein
MTFEEVLSRTTKEYLKVQSLSDLEEISKKLFDNIVVSNPKVNEKQLIWHLGFISFIRLSLAYHSSELDPHIYAHKMFNFSEEADEYFGKLLKGEL